MTLELWIKSAAELRSLVGEFAETIQMVTQIIDDLENRSRRNNLLIFGLNNTENETAMDLSESVKCNVFDKVNVNPRSIERMHRLGKKRRSCRPVIVRLYDREEKMAILRN